MITSPAQAPHKRPTSPKQLLNCPEPKQRAVPGVHDAARRLLSELPKGKLLDVAAGNGAMSYWAVNQGFDVTAVDINQDLFELDNVPHVAADLNESLPLADNSSDTTVACEIIEHLENHFFFMRELARVTRPGGHVVLSTPNEHNIQNRLAYFTTGYYGHSRHLIREDDPLLPLRHINMIPLSKLELAWRRAGLELVKFEVSRYRRWSYLLFPFMYPIQSLRLSMRMQWFVRDQEAKELNRRVYNIVNDPRIFMGRTIVYLLRKPAP